MKVYCLIIFVVLFIQAKSQTKNFIDQPYIEVTGKADSLVTPNEIFIKILLSEKDNKGKTSVEENEIKMVNAFKALGINTEKDLTVRDMESNFKFYFLKRTDIVKSREYVLKVSDAKTAGRVFIALEDLGISNTSIDHVNHSDLENIKNAVRSKAVENAKRKAIALVKPLNQNIGLAIFITDTEANNNLNYGRLDEVRITGLDKSKTFNQEQAPPIEFEKIQVNSSVNIKFTLGK